METKHTKGKWKTHFIYSAWDVVVNGMEVAQNIGGESEEEREANAKLIAAAPELLKALQSLYKSTSAVMELLADSPNEVHEDPIFKKAQQAINKALGSE